MKVIINEISKKIASKFNVDIKIVQEVNRSQWKMLFDIMQADEDRAVKIIYLGKFFRKSEKTLKLSAWRKGRKRMKYHIKKNNGII